MELLGIPQELAEKREAIASKLSPMARRQAFPGIYATPVPREATVVADPTPPLKAEIAALKAEILALKQENDRLLVLSSKPKADAEEPTIKEVVDAFCDEMNARELFVGDERWSMSLIRSPRRSHTVSRPRQVCMWLVRTLCSRPSYPVIGQFFGGKDHTTIMHGMKKTPSVLEARPEMLDVATTVLRSFGVVLARLERGEQS